MSGEVELRDVVDADLDRFFAHQCDAEAAYMLGFRRGDPTDRAMFDAHWKKIRSEPGNLILTVLHDGHVAGHACTFHREGNREVGYWIGRESWGRGVATRVLERILELDRARPMNARVAKDNAASIRVLQKCGFRVVGEDRGYSTVRRTDVEGFVFELSSTDHGVHSGQTT
ncbi:MAG: GNAT family N-acetyltransferase [Planctomycetota bacterium]